ncbi:MAG: hypothetical protein OEW80_04725 [Gemmatimonadota bacterium]|nr:hypothetical protein [Gemmatimonadota bacterium]
MAAEEDISHRIPLADVVAITRIKTSSPFNRIDGYFDFGFTYAKSNPTRPCS